MSRLIDKGKNTIYLSNNVQRGIYRKRERERETPILLAFLAFSISLATTTLSKTTARGTTVRICGLRDIIESIGTPFSVFLLNPIVFIRTISLEIETTSIGTLPRHSFALIVRLETIHTLYLIHFLHSYSIKLALV